MLVVSDTTPISELSKVGELSLLQALFEEVTIPNEVYAELIAGSHSAATLVSTLDWLNVCAVTDVEQIEVLQRDAKIHIGEAAANCSCRRVTC